MYRLVTYKRLKCTCILKYIQTHIYKINAVQELKNHGEIFMLKTSELEWYTSINLAQI